MSHANNNTPKDDSRRQLLTAAAGLIAAHAAGDAISAPKETKSAPKTVGKAGDFNFLAGNWVVANKQLKKFGGTEWDTFASEATVYTILAGAGSVEELRIPVKNFSGMGLRLLDVEKKIWVDHWVNAKSGVLTLPGSTGVFENGVDIFDGGDWEDKGQKYLSRGVWDRITPTTCRWVQASSKDNGKTWQENWVMNWTRA